MTRANRLEQGEVAWARERRLKEVLMWSVIREFSAYFIFLSLLFLITYSNGNTSAFYQVQHLRNSLHNTRQTGNDYTKVSSLLRAEFITVLSLIDHYDQSVLELAGELADQQSSSAELVQRPVASESLWLSQRQVQSTDRMGNHAAATRSIDALSSEPSLEDVFR